MWDWGLGWAGTALVLQPLGAKEGAEGGMLRPPPVFWACGQAWALEMSVKEVTSMEWEKPQLSRVGHPILVMATV